MQNIIAGRKVNKISIELTTKKMTIISLVNVQSQRDHHFACIYWTHSHAINIFLCCNFGSCLFLLLSSFNSFSISSKAQNSWNVSVIHLKKEKEKKVKKSVCCVLSLLRKITSYFFSSRIAFASKESEEKNSSRKVFFQGQFIFYFCCWCCCCLMPRNRESII